MGLDSRDYMNPDADDGASSGGLLANLSVANRLLLLNVLVWLAWQVWARSAFLHDHFMVSADGLLEHRRVWTLVTYAFSHLQPWHLLVNGLFLYWFGGDLERTVGRRGLLLAYLGGAVAGALTQVAFNLRTPELRAVPMVGASGAVMAIVIWTTLLAPQRRVLIWGVVPAPLWALAAAFVAIDLFGAARQLSPEAGAEPLRVGHGAHLGGALAGVLCKLLDLRAASRGGRGASTAPWTWLATAWRRRRLRVLPPLRDADPAAARRDDLPAPASAVAALRRIDPETEAKVDDLLRKINREGLQSLTAEEKTFLEQASSRYRR